MELDFEVAPYGTQVGRVFIVGAPGAGKTTLAVPLARSMCPDPDKIYAIGPVPTLAYKLGVPARDIPTTDREAQETFFAKQLAEAKRLYPEGERLLAVDEADLYFSQTGRTYGSDSLREICNTGRNHFISQIYIARGPLDLSRNARGTVNCLFIGQAAEPRTAEWFEDFTGIEGFGRMLADFPPHRFVVYVPNRVPHVLGIAWVEGGVIRTKPWTAPTLEDGANPSSSDGSNGDPTPDDTAPTPGAAGPSRTGTGPTSAGSTGPSTTASSTGSAN